MGLRIPRRKSSCAMGLSLRNSLLILGLRAVYRLTLRAANF